VSFTLIDRQPAGANTSRAAVVHARTLEVLERLDVTRRLCDEGIVVPTFTIRERDRVLATIPFGWLPTRYPYTLMIPQQVTEAILLRRLMELGGQVHRPYALKSVRQDDAGVSLDLDGPDGQSSSLRARYVVGADGVHSVVRQQAGIAFVGATYDDSFVLADVHMSWPVPKDQVSLFFSAEGLVVVAPLPGERHRIVAACDAAPEAPDMRFMQALLDARGPITGAGCIHDIVWSSRFRVHHRLAERYRAGRVLLAGDAAHVHSPAGGQGMNTGIQDAMALGDSLADVIQGSAGSDRLTSYERVRRQVAKRVVGFTHRMTRVATLHSLGKRRARNALLSRVGRVAPVRRRIAMTLSGLRNR
jgi:2-polyprenyl-6-methoxyphenol hydroxylase-like FAD-dependent oxidoreductase